MPTEPRAGETPAESKVVDLMAALEKSVREARSAREERRMGPDPTEAELRTVINEHLHFAFGGEPCDTACTHVLMGNWTALGVANVASRRMVELDRGDERG